MNIPTCPVPELMCSYRTEQPEVNGSGVDVAPNITKCAAQVISAVCLATYRTEHILHSILAFEVNTLLIWVKTLRILFLSEGGSFNEWIFS